jgi:hypothetical protein
MNLDYRKATKDVETFYVVLMMARNTKKLLVFVDLIDIMEPELIITIVNTGYFGTKKTQLSPRKIYTRFSVSSSHRTCSSPLLSQLVCYVAFDIIESIRLPCDSIIISSMRHANDFIFRQK